MAMLTITLLVLALLGVAVVPIDRVRAIALCSLSFLLHGATLAALVACGAFALRPQFVPENLGTYFANWNAEIRALAPRLAQGGEWLVLALVLTLVGVPLLELVTFARQINEYRSGFQRWVRELGRMGNDLREVVADPQATPQQKDRVRDAGEAFVEMSQPSPRRGARCSLYELLTSRKPRGA